MPTPKYSSVLSAVGKTEGAIAQSEQQFINSTKESVLRPFYSFVDNDAKTIFKVCVCVCRRTRALLLSSFVTVTFISLTYFRL